MVSLENKKCHPGACAQGRVSYVARGCSLTRESWSEEAVEETTGGDESAYKKAARRISRGYSLDRLYSRPGKPQCDDTGSMRIYGLGDEVQLADVLASLHQYLGKASVGFLALLQGKPVAAIFTGMTSDAAASTSGLFNRAKRILSRLRRPEWRDIVVLRPHLSQRHVMSCSPGRSQDRTRESGDRMRVRSARLRGLAGTIWLPWASPFRDSEGVKSDGKAAFTFH